MEYIIDLDSLNSKSSELLSISQRISTTNNNCEEALNRYSNTEISSLINKVKKSIKRLDTGTTNASIWLKNYLEEVNNLENDLTNFTGSLNAPKEFTSQFTDMFSKITIPAIKTGGNKNINNSLGPSNQEDTEK